MDRNLKHFYNLKDFENYYFVTYGKNIFDVDFCTIESLEISEDGNLETVYDVNMENPDPEFNGESFVNDAHGVDIAFDVTEGKIYSFGFFDKESKIFVELKGPECKDAFFTYMGSNRNSNQKTK